MRRARHQHPIFQPYSDVLLNVLGSFIVIVAVLILTMNVKAKHNLDAHPHAEYMVTLEWDNNRNVDLDLWLLDPYDHAIYYNNREANNISLDRDSRGALTNWTTLPSGKVIHSDNREVVAIRSVIPGDYVVGVSYYAGGEVAMAPDGKSYQSDPYMFGRGDPRAAIDFKVRVEKVNPHMTTISEETFHFNYVKESKNVAAFHIDEDGKITALPTPPGSMPAEHGALQ